MKVVHTRAELAAARAEAAGRRLTFVPTMGALHAGHRALLQQARTDSAAALHASIFVNPLQFGAGEDLARYPRPIDADLAVCEDEGVDVVFAPSADELYGEHAPVVTVSAGELGNVLEGRTRPGHFDGVLTVVAKFFHLVRPDAAYFGEKDAQQLALVRRMVADLDFGIDIVGVPTVRDADGLALSSRNAYLSADERTQARALSQALSAAAQLSHAAAAVEAAQAVLDGERGVRLDYLELVDADTFAPVDGRTSRALLLVAAWVGGTRLIDNVTLHPGVTVER